MAATPAGRARTPLPTAALIKLNVVAGTWLFSLGVVDRNNLSLSFLLVINDSGVMEAWRSHLYMEYLGSCDVWWGCTNGRCAMGALVWKAFTGDSLMNKHRIQRLDPKIHIIDVFVGIIVLFMTTLVILIGKLFFVLVWIPKKWLEGAGRFKSASEIVS